MHTLLNYVQSHSLTYRWDVRHLQAAPHIRAIMHTYPLTYLLTYLLMVGVQQTPQLQQVGHYTYLLTYLLTYGGNAANTPATASRPLCTLAYLLTCLHTYGGMQQTSQLQQVDHYAYVLTCLWMDCSKHPSYSK